jgi:hypothetical protein
MRILHSLKRRRAKEQGAISVLVLVLLLVFVGFLAVVIDIGVAYATKRQLSVAADAAAVAAARAVSQALPPGAPCNASSLQSVASTAANRVNTQNDLNAASNVSSVTVTCPAGGVGDEIQVTVRNQEQVRAIFADTLGFAAFNPPGAAVARIFVPNAVATGLRPIAACAPRVQYSTSNGEPLLVEISKETAVCGTSTGGQWGYTNFLNQGTLFGNANISTAPAYYPDETCYGGNVNSGANAPCQEKWIEQGYAGPVYFPNPAIQGTNDGLAANTGFVSSVSDELEGLVGQDIQLPVATRFVDNSGTDRFDITGVVTARVCSVRLGPAASAITQGPNSGPCQNLVTPTAAFPTNEPGLYLTRWETMKNNEALLWVVPVKYETSGVVGGVRPGCIGNASCDLGTRAVQLYK